MCALGILADRVANIEKWIQQLTRDNYNRHGYETLLALFVITTFVSVLIVWPRVIANHTLSVSDTMAYITGSVIIPLAMFLAALFKMNKIPPALKHSFTIKTASHDNIG